MIEQCKAGVVGAMPALNARPASQLDEWLAEITETLAAYDRANPDGPAAPFAINQIVHKSNDRLEHDMAGVRQVQGADRHHLAGRAHRRQRRGAQLRRRGAARHHQQLFARKAIEKGADGLIAVAAGAGGHAGVKSPFALVQEIRQWFDGPIALCGAIATGGAVLAAQAMGADFAYIGSAFIATDEARASDAYKQAIVDGSTDDIVYCNLFTGVHGNYLKRSHPRAGLDPDNLPESDASKMNFGGGEQQEGLEGHLGLRPGHRRGRPRCCPRPSWSRRCAASTRWHCVGSTPRQPGDGAAHADPQRHAVRQREGRAAAEQPHPDRRRAVCRGRRRTDRGRDGARHRRRGPRRAARA